MTTYDRVLIDPAPEELQAEMAKAVAAANRGAGNSMLAWPPADLTAILERVQGESEGFQQWSSVPTGVPERRLSTVLALAWWSDWNRRKHLRVVSRHGVFDSRARFNCLAPTQRRSALWLVYPERAYLRLLGREWKLTVICSCGVWGAPEDLAWMGDRCGPCHDRLESAVPIPGAGLARCVIKSGTWARGMTFAPDSRLLVWEEEKAWSWDLASDGVTNFPLEGQELLSTVCAPDGTLAASVCEEALIVWDHQTGLELWRASYPHPRQPLDVASMKNGRLVYLAGGMQYHSTCEIVVCDMEARGKPVQVVPVPDSVLIDLAPDDRRAAIGSPQGEVEVWDLETGKRLLSWPSARGGVTSLAFSPDGRLLAAATRDGRLRVRDTKTGEETGCHNSTRQTCCNQCAFSPDGQTLIAGTADGILRLLDAETAKLKAAWRWHTGSVHCLALSPDGRWLATGGADGFIKLWPLPVLLANASLR
jgi:WD40 repeat protein